MADIEKITIAGQDYDIADATARQNVSNKQDKLTTANAGSNITITEVGGIVKINSTATGGTTDYSDLSNKPQINGTELSGNLTSSELGLQDTLSEGDGILIENDATISVKTDGTTVGFNAEGELISEVKESVFRGEFANWSSVPEDEDDFLPDHNQNTNLSANDYIIIDDASDYENEEYTIQFKKTGSNGVRFYINDTLISTTYGSGTSYGNGLYGDLNIYYYYNQGQSTVEIVGLRDFFAARAGDEPVRVKTKGLLQIEWDNTIDSYVYTLQAVVPPTDGKWKFIRLSDNGDVKNSWLPAYRLDKDDSTRFSSGEHVIAEYDQEMDSYKLESKNLLPTLDRDSIYNPANENEIKVFADKEKIIIWQDIDMDGELISEQAMIPGKFYKNHKGTETSETIKFIQLENFYNDYSIDEDVFKARLEANYHSGVGQFRIMHWTADDGKIIQGIELYDYVTDSVIMYSRTSIDHIEDALLNYGITAHIVDTSEPCALTVYFTTGYHPIITTTANIDKSQCSVEVARFISAMQNHNYKKLAFKATISNNTVGVHVTYTNSFGMETEDPHVYGAEEANDYFYDNYGVYLPFWDDGYTKNGDYVSFLLSSESLINEWIEIPNPYDYESLNNKPSINGCEITGDVSLDDIGVASENRVSTIEESIGNMKFWSGTLAQYNNVSVKDPNTLYVIRG